MYIIVIGGDEMVYYLARQLRQQDHRVVIINRNKMHCTHLYEQTQATVIHGDGSDQSILEEAGARKADVVIALTPYDQDNLVSCQIAQKIYDVPRTIALVNDPDNEDIFHELGVSVAFSSTRVIGNMIETQANFDHIKRLVPLGDGKLHITDVVLDQESPVVGKTLAEINLSPDTLVVSIIRDDDVIIPRGSNRLQAGDHVLVISRPDEEIKDLETLTGEKL